MINHERLRRNFLELTVIEGVSGNEERIMNEIKGRLDRLDIQYAQDDAGNGFGGECGNVIAFIPGTEKGKPFFMSAHVDTISSSSGKPVIREGVFYSDGSTILGADDRAGVAAMLEAAEAVIEHNIPHTGLELLFLVGEEIGLCGSKYLDYDLIKSASGFVLDSSADLGKVVSHAPTHSSCRITVRGKAAHGAIAPELGIHAIKIAADAIHNIEVGRVTDNTTVSIGTIKGGTKVNVVPDFVEIKGEIRSLDEAEIPEYTQKIETCFRDAAEHYGGSIDIEWKSEYKGFKLDEGHNVIRWIIRAMEQADVIPGLIKFIGGSDANNFNRHGIPTINLGLGYKKNHSNEEYMKVDDLIGITEIVMELIRLSPQYGDAQF
ncbi:M20/M25/M40 family metallo-hydrolase [candidate division KSB1 bacterium]